MLLDARRLARPGAVIAAFLLGAVLVTRLPESLLLSALAFVLVLSIGLGWRLMLASNAVTCRKGFASSLLGNLQPRYSSWSASLAHPKTLVVLLLLLALLAGACCRMLWIACA